jgi:hypothetical protein
MGAWIETLGRAARLISALATPTRECGLKHHDSADRPRRDLSAPTRGAWIETSTSRARPTSTRARLRRGERD